MLSLPDGGIIEWLEQRLNHAMQFFFPSLLVGCVVLQLNTWLLPSCSRFQRCFFEQQFLQVVCGVEVLLLARGCEDRLDLLLFQGLKVDLPEEGVVREAFEARSSYSFCFVLFQQGTDGM